MVVAGRPLACARRSPSLPSSSSSRSSGKALQVALRRSVALRGRPGHGRRPTSTSRPSPQARRATSSCRTSGTSPAPSASLSSAIRRPRCFGLPRGCGPLHLAARPSSASSSAAFIGIMLATIFVHSALCRAGLHCPMSSPARPSPSSALAPILVVAFGRACTSVVIIATYLTFFPVTIAEMRGLRSPDPRSLELMRSLRGVTLGHLAQAAAARLGALPLHRAQDRGRRRASSAPSSARVRAA